MQPGQLIAGEFMLQKLLAQGVTGEVWRALETKVGRLVRLRFIPRRFMDDAAAADRLRRHVEAVQSFRHPHVVATERLVEASEGGAFLVARHVEGPLLDEYAAQWIKAEGKFPFNLVFEVLRPVASALDEARENHLVHRSLTPQHIVVSQTEGIQILDFDLYGILREELEPADSKSLLTDPNRLRYMAPEQLLGQPASHLSDEYSFAMIVAEVLGNRLMFTTTDPEQLRWQILTLQPPMLQDYPFHVNASLQRALYKDPEVRFPSCIHFLDGLAGLIAVAFPPPYSVGTTGTPAPSVAASSSGSMPVVLMPAKTETKKNLVDSLVPESMSGATDSQVVENIASFDKIASQARTASAKNIATKIRKERRFKQFFFLWNVLVLIACLITAWMFRGHISQVWRQRVEGEGPVVVDTNGDDSEVDRDRRSRQRPARPAPERRTRKEKEVTFDDEGESPFPNIDDADATDEVRFLGTSGKGKKILFVVDASSVMGSGKLSPWEHVQKELVFSFKDLNRSQKYQVVYYNDQPNLLPGAEDGDPWLAVSPESLKNSYEFIKGISGSGTGNPAKALEKAISLGPDVIFFLSDRDSAALTKREIDDLKRSTGSVPIHAVEIGDGDEPAAKSPIHVLARTFRGEYRWINANFHGLKR